MISEQGKQLYRNDAIYCALVQTLRQLLPKYGAVMLKEAIDLAEQKQQLAERIRLNRLHPEAAGGTGE